MFLLNPSETEREYNRLIASDTQFYEPFETYSKLFYWHLMCKMVDDLRGVVLEKKVPYIDSPFYSREDVMIRYMDGMMVMKPRGEEWELRFNEILLIP